MPKVATFATRRRASEVALLASAIRSEQPAQVLTAIEPEALSPESASLWKTCLALHREHGRLDEMLLTITPDVDGETLERVLRWKGSTQEPEKHLSAVRAASAIDKTMRMCRALSVKLEREPLNPSSNAEAILGVAAHLQRIVRELDLKDESRLLKAATERALEQATQAEQGEALSTGVPDLDARIGGLKPGTMCVIVGKSGHGKSSLALTAALHAGVRGRRTLYVSREMERSELAWRFAAASLDESISLIQSDVRHDAKLRTEIIERADLPIDIDDRLSALAGATVILSACLLSGMQSPAGMNDEKRDILRHMTIVWLDDGQGGTAKTIRFTGVNVQVVNGLKSTNGFPFDPDSVDPLDTVVNSVGNLIVGYNELGNPLGFGDNRTGSHNIVVGHGNNYTSFGGIVGPRDNMTSAPFASVTGGRRNTASGLGSSVSGGSKNTASGRYSAVSGGGSEVAVGGNEASGLLSSVSGGWDNKALGLLSSVSGGKSNTASGYFSSVSGGGHNTASYLSSSVSGGAGSTASGKYSSVSGGQFHTAGGGYSSVSGGSTNVANGWISSVSGGRGNTASEHLSSVSGGASNTASGYSALVSGGFHNTASGYLSSVSGGSNRSVSGTNNWRGGKYYSNN